MALGALNLAAQVYGPSCDCVTRCAWFGCPGLWPVTWWHKRGVLGESSMGQSPRWARVIKMAATEKDWRKFVFDDYLMIPETNIYNVLLLVTYYVGVDLHRGRSRRWVKSLPCILPHYFFQCIHTPKANPSILSKLTMLIQKCITKIEKSLVSIIISIKAILYHATLSLFMMYTGLGVLGDCIHRQLLPCVPVDNCT